MLKVLGVQQQDSPTIYCNNVSIIKILRNPVCIEEVNISTLDIVFLWDLCNNGKIELKFGKSEDEATDLMTKPPKEPVFEKHDRSLFIT